MATYEYECTDDLCKHKWEEEQGMSDDVITKCPECKKETAKRLISGGTGFILNGGGWFNSGGY